MDKLKIEWTDYYTDHKTDDDQYRVYDADEVDKEIKQLDKIVNEKDKKIELLEKALKEMYEICMGYNEMKSIITPDNKYLFSNFSISKEYYDKLVKIVEDIK